jgi:hypothetical protein
MKIGVPFYGSKIEQLPDKDLFDAVEATLFHRRDLELDVWCTTWRNINEAIRRFDASNVAFHFPFNECNYLEEPFVYARLEEAYERACDLGIAGIVVHASQVRSVEEWLLKPNVAETRARVAETLQSVVQRQHSPETFLALENMPVIGNFGLEVDPTFVYPEDFVALNGTQVGITWDVCHFMITQTVTSGVLNGKLQKEDFPFLSDSSWDRSQSFFSRVCHLHFSAFKGLPLSGGSPRTLEGRHPSESDVGEEHYTTALREMLSSGNAQIVTLEIEEEDYSTHPNAVRVHSWLQRPSQIFTKVQNGRC